MVNIGSVTMLTDDVEELSNPVNFKTNPILAKYCDKKVPIMNFRWEPDITKFCFATSQLVNSYQKRDDAG